MRIVQLFFIIFSILFMSNSISNAVSKEAILLQLKYGDVIIELYPEKAPNHVKRMIDLVNEGFYNGLKFHRVIDGFMVQTGDPKGNGTGGSDKPDLKAEFNDIKHTRGILSMARSADPNSANSQFFIMLGDASYLDGQYTAFGKVIKGMEFIDMIKKGNSAMNGTVIDPDVIVRMTVIEHP